MKGYKKVICLVIAFLMVVSLPAVTGVESRADENNKASENVLSGFPKEGDTIGVRSYLPENEGRVEVLEVANITPYVISSAKWEYSLIVYFYKFKPITNDTECIFDGMHSYVIQRESMDNNFYFLERAQITSDEVLADEQYINNYLDTLKKDSQTGEGSIQYKIDNNYSLRWNIPEKKSAPTQIPAPTPHEHNWQHGVIYPASEGVEGLEGDYCTECNLTRNTSPIPASSVIMENREHQIEWASPAKVSILEMKTLCSLPNYFLKMIDAKKNCDFTLRFTYNKKHFEIYIPAGTQFDNSLDWYGPEQLLAMFEYKELY